MPENLIYPEKSPDMIVRLRCKNCQHQGEAADFLKLNPVVNICPQCQEKYNLVLILNNQKEIDLTGNRGIPLNLYPILILCGLLMFLAYKLFPLIFFIPIFIALLVGMLVIVFKETKK